MLDSIDILIDIARKGKSEFTPILKYEDNDDADAVCKDLQDNCEQPDVIFTVREEGGMHYIGIGFLDVMPCGGELDKYCEKCKVVHFSIDGINSAELKTKKEEFYRSWYDRRRRVRDQGALETQ